MAQHYSPSQTSDFAFCPRYWALRREGWSGRSAGKKDEAAVFGLGFHAAMTAWYGRLLASREVAEPVETAVAAALGTFDQVVVGWQENGVSYDSGKIDELRVILPKLVQRYIKADPMPKNWSVVAIEQPIPHEGNLRPDLVCLDENGFPVPVDFKTRLDLAKAEWRAKWIDEFATGWQQWHQASAVGARRYVVVPVISAPFSASWEVYEFQEPKRALFQETARRIWTQLEVARMRICRPWERPGAVVHSNRYGDCEFLGACARGLDEATLAAEGYVRIERRKP